METLTFVVEIDVVQPHLRNQIALAIARVLEEARDRTVAGAEVLNHVETEQISVYFTAKVVR